MVSKTSSLTLAYIAGIATAFAGILALIGWQLDNYQLKTFGFGEVTMKPNAAALFLLSGLTLLFLQFRHPIAKWFSRIFSSLIILVGFLTLAEFIFTLNFGIDELLYSVKDTTGFIPHPSRIAANAALNFVLLGMVLFYLSLYRTRINYFIEFCLVAAFSIGMVGYLSFVFGFGDSAGATGYSRMAVNAATSFIILCFGIYFTIRQRYPNKITIEQKLFAGLTISAIIIIFISFLSFSNLESMHDAADKVKHTYIVKNKIEDVLTSIIDIETSARGFALSGNDQFLEPMVKAKLEINNQIVDLRNRTKDNPHQQNNINKLEQLIIKKIKRSDLTVQTRKLKGLTATIPLINTGRGQQLSDSIRALKDKMIAEENRLLLLRDKIEDLRMEQSQTVIIAGIIFQLSLLTLIFLFVSNDVSGKRKAEKELQRLNEDLEEIVEERTNELRQNEARLIKAQQIAHLGFLDWNLKTNEIICSDEVYQLYGIIKDENFTSLENISKGVHPDDKEFAKINLELAIKGEKKYNIDHRIVRPNGEIIWVNAQAELILDENGNQKSLLGSILDITERKHSEEILREKEEHFRRTLELGVVGIATTHPTTYYFLSANKRLCEMVGYTEEELLQMTWAEITFPKEKVVEDAANVEKLLSGEHNGYVMEKQYQHKDGHMIDITLSVQGVRKKDGNIDYILIMVDDITERKLAVEKLRESEQRFQNAFEYAAIGMTVVALDGHFLRVNKSLCNILGYSKEEFMSKTFQEITHLDDLQADLENLSQLLAGKINSYDMEKRYFHKSGQIIWALLNVSLVSEKKGQALYFIAQIEDITNRKQSEEKILKLNAELEQKVEERTGQLSVTIENLHKEIEERRQVEDKLQSIEWMLGDKDISNDTFEPLHGNITRLNTDRTILDAVGEDTLKKIVKEFMSLLGTSSAIYEKNGDYATGIFSSGWCRRLDAASFEICETENLQQALNCGNWLCHESCWTDVSKIAINTGKITDIECNGGIHLYAVPICIGDEIIGAINFGYGDPPRNIEKLSEIALKYKVDIEELKKLSKRYETRPQFIIDLAKERLIESAHLIALIVQRKRTEVQLEASNENLLKEINERRQIENRFKLVVESAPNAIILVGSNGKIQLINKQTENYFGYNRSELIGNRLEMLVPNADGIGHEHLRSVYISHPEARNMGTGRDLFGLRKDGTKIPIEVGLNPIRINNETLILTSIIDITERKKAEEEIKNAKTEAERANLAKSEFLSRMSHELRTPLNSILGFTQLMNMGELNPTHKKGVDHIMKSGKHLLNLINEVLDLSRIEAGELSISIEPVELNGIILETLDVIHPLAVENNVKIEFANVGTQQLFVKADQQKLKQVLLNLINNAVKYNSKGGLVTIEAANVKNEKIRISVTDTGEGIAEEELHKLFTPFQRIGTEISIIEGTGLGLAVSKKLMEAMSGSIGVESEAGTGSTFWIELPQTNGQLENHLIEVDFEVLPINKTNISGILLYIEDNVSNQELVKQIINTHRPEIKLITNLYGRDTLKLALDYKPNLILLDLDLPDIHGSKVLELLQKNPQTKDMPVIILSADAMGKQIEKLKNAGAKAYLTKPIDVMEFLKVIDDAMGN